MDINTLMEALSDAYARQKQTAEQLRKELIACQTKIKELTSIAVKEQSEISSLSKDKSKELTEKPAKPAVKGESARKK